jgi:hypothetical protein
LSHRLVAFFIKPGLTYLQDLTHSIIYKKKKRKKRKRKKKEGNERQELRAAEKKRKRERLEFFHARSVERLRELRDYFFFYI